MYHQGNNEIWRWGQRTKRDGRRGTAHRYCFGEIRISWDRAKIPLTGKQAAEKLKNGQPRIVYYDDDEGGVLQTRTMVDGEEIFAARRLRQFFRDEAPLGA